MKTRKTTRTNKKLNAVSQETLDNKEIECRVTERNLDAETTNDPRGFLFRTAREHRAIMKRAVSFENSVTTKKDRKTGQPIKNWVPYDVEFNIKQRAEEMRERAAEIEPAMKRALKRLPIYGFTKQVSGFGDAIIAAYIIGEIDFTKCAKPSQLVRFCGLAVINGSFERPKKGEKNHYSKEMRTRLYQFMTTMLKCSAKKTKNAPNGSTNKYLDRWYEAQQFLKERYPERKGKVHRTAMWKACELFLYDLYIYGRTSMGLPVWTTYYDYVRGYEHKTGRKLPLENAPRMLTMEEAVEIIGDVSQHPLDVLRSWKVLDTDKEPEPEPESESTPDVVVDDATILAA